MLRRSAVVVGFLVAMIAGVWIQRAMSEETPASKVTPASTATASKAVPTASAASTTTAAPTASAPARTPAKELTLDLGGGTTLPLTLIPAGKFLMGSPAGEAGRDNDETQHEVTVSKPFYMGVYDVTRGQFAAFIKDSGYKTDAEKKGWAYAWDGSKFDEVKGARWRNPGFDQTDVHPVVCVNWNDASAFCQWLSRKTDRLVRLPTEAEWEYACRAGTTTAYQWGDNPDNGKGWCNAADQTAKRQFKDWTVFNWDDGFVFTAPAGQFRANAWGLFDMHGNVWEWCADWYRDYPGGAVTDPTGAAAGQGRVLRGGSWCINPRFCRSGYRHKHTPDDCDYQYGFRAVVSVGN